MTQSGRHSFLFSCGWRVIKFFIVVDVKLFMSLTISSSSFFLLPIIMWMWLGIIHLRRRPLDIHIFQALSFPGSVSRNQLLPPCILLLRKHLSSKPLRKRWNIFYHYRGIYICGSCSKCTILVTTWISKKFISASVRLWLSWITIYQNTLLKAKLFEEIAP